jgi:quercetin dioxygenase-like cupin family protein
MRLLINLCRIGGAEMTRLSIALGLAMLCPTAVLSQEVPDALAVEWEGKRLCEALFEDEQVRILRCTFPPGTAHLRHSHPKNFSYTLSGGKVKVVDEKGTREGDLAAGRYFSSPPVAWHEVTNTGDTTVAFLAVEMKYQK